MKAHNGGAISVTCYYLTDETQQDYFASSGYSFYNISNNNQSINFTNTTQLNNSI